MPDKINIFDHTIATLENIFVGIGEKPFRAQQVIHWVHQQGVTDFNLMTNLSLSLRQWLIANAEINMPQIIREQQSFDGTRKWLCELADQKTIEMVFIPEDQRGTLCISSQVGCPLQCVFCATGMQGFTRNLEVSEIIGQLWLATKILSDATFAKKHAVTNVVFMGMGEPLLNFDNVIKATELMLSDLAYGLSKYKVTLSTAGLVPEMWRLREVSEVSLAVSLHAPNDELRSKLMPINDKYPLAELMNVCRNYFKDERRMVTFEYIMLDGINDSELHARQLVKLLSGIRCKVNLLQANQIAGSSYKCSKFEVIENFRNVLFNADINTITRKVRGADILAACGQLSGSQ